MDTHSQTNEEGFIFPTMTQAAHLPSGETEPLRKLPGAPRIPIISFAVDASLNSVTSTVIPPTVTPMQEAAGVSKSLYPPVNMQPNMANKSYSSSKMSSTASGTVWLEICSAKELLVVRGKGTFELKDALKVLMFKWNEPCKAWISLVNASAHLSYIAEALEALLLTRENRAVVATISYSETWKRMFIQDKIRDTRITPEDITVLYQIYHPEKKYGAAAAPTRQPAAITREQLAPFPQSCSFEIKPVGGNRMITVTSTVTKPVVGMTVTTTNVNGPFVRQIVHVFENEDEFICDFGEEGSEPIQALFYIAGGTWKCALDRTATVKLE